MSPPTPDDPGSYIDATRRRQIPPEAPGPATGAGHSHQLPEAVGDRYQWQQLVGEGRMGQIWRGLDTRLDRLVALKRIRPELAQLPGLLQRLRAEATSMAQLNHPGVVQIYDFATDDNGPFLVMQWVEGRSLAEVLAEDGPMAPAKAAQLIARMALAMQQAHAAGIIHRDIRCDNILLTERNEPLITDFSMAVTEVDDRGTTAETRPSGSRPTSTVDIVGSLEYMPPEQMRDPRAVTAASDIYSLGATLYRLVTGRSPARIISRHTPAGLRDVIEKATEERPGDRFASMQQFAAALRQASKVLSGGPARPAVGNARDGQPAASPAPPVPPAIPSAPVPEQTQASATRPAPEAPPTWKLTRREFWASVGALAALAGVKAAFQKSNRVDTVTTPLPQPEILLPADTKSPPLDTPPADPATTATQADVTESSPDPLATQPESAAPAAAEREPEVTEQKPEVATKEPDLEPKAAEPAPKSVDSQPGTSAEQSSPRTRPELLQAPFGRFAAAAAQSEWARYLGINPEVTNNLGMKFRVIPPGTFVMGSPLSEPLRGSNEHPHTVTISRPALLGIFPVTQEEWTRVTGVNPSRLQFVGRRSQETSRFPVESVSWLDCQQFLTLLNEQYPLPGNWLYRLPTDAEWEYACRAGTTTPFWFGNGLNGKSANCNGQRPYPSDTSTGPSLQRTSMVGSYGANPFGLYDQHGNVWEWCADRHDSDYYLSSPAIDPPGPPTESTDPYRRARGGAFHLDARYCRSAYFERFGESTSRPTTGLRVLAENMDVL